LLIVSPSLPSSWTPELKQIHDELDAAVFDAYGWPSDRTDEQTLGLVTQHTENNKTAWYFTDPHYFTLI
jgi:hypothetical protein